MFDVNTGHREVLKDALVTDDVDTSVDKFGEYMDLVGEDITAKAMESVDGVLLEVTNDRRDREVINSRTGAITLTTEEMEFFNEAVEYGTLDTAEVTKFTMKNVEEVAFPVTIVESIFDDLTTTHPLLSAINTQYTGAIVRYVLAKPTVQRAFWGNICSDIRQLVVEGFEIKEFNHSKLSGFIPVCKGMIELGANWLARYVITVMREIFEVTLVEAVINGDGDNKPIGMTRRLTGAVDGVHPKKNVIKDGITSFSSLLRLKALYVAGNKKRNVTPTLILNETTLFGGVLTKMTVSDDNANYVSEEFKGVMTSFNIGAKTGNIYGVPYIIENAVPDGIIIFGDPKDYDLMISGSFRIDRYDQTLAIQDLDLYIGKMFAYGLHKYANSFLVINQGLNIDESLLEDIEELDFDSGRLDGRLFGELPTINTKPTDELEEV